MPVAFITAASDSGNFLVTPGLGLMIWTLLAFGITLLLLRKLAFPRIQEALERRQKAIEESLLAAERSRDDAEKLLEEYRQRLAEARHQADEIVVRARHAGQVHQEEAHADALARRDELMAQTRRDIQIETQRALQEIRREVANLTVAATEKVTRKALTETDQRRLVEEALSELDFQALSASSGAPADGRGA